SGILNNVIQITGNYLHRQQRWTMIADFRGRSTCLFPTQSRPMMSRFSLVFSGFEHGELGVV
ncbi:MAG: hypothetical protein ACXVBY_21245, partial [Isosphaeraceae bacterium]